MFRTLLTLLVALAIAAEASAQSAPAATTKTTVRTKTAVRRPAAKTKRTTTHKATKTVRTANTTAQPAPEYGTRTDIGPGGNGATGSTESADGKGQGVYAAPGMPVNVDNPKKVEGYNGPAPARPRNGTTLTPR